MPTLTVPLRLLSWDFTPCTKDLVSKDSLPPLYQAVSGAGAAGFDALENELKAQFAPAENSPTATKDSLFPHPIAHNLLPHIDEFREDGYTKEELKMKNESRKILGTPSLKVSCTCVRVPVYRAHSISLSAEFSQPVNVPDAKSAIEGFSGAELWDIPNANRYPTPLQYAGKEDCGVGRIRIDQAF